MSLESAIETLNATLTTTNELFTKQNALMAAAVEKAASAAPAGTKAAGTKAATTTAAATKAADKPATTTAKTFTVEDIKTAYGSYIQEVKTDAAESTARKAMVSKIAKHFEAAKVTEADPKHYPELMAFYDKIKAGEDPFPAEAVAEEEDSPV